MFSMKINLGSVASPKAPNQLISGVYTGTITDVSMKPNDRVLFKIESTTDGFNGSVAFASIRLAKSPTDGVIYLWRLLSESVGYTQEELEYISEWTPDHFKGRNCFFEFTSKGESKTGYDETSFLTEWQYSKKKAEKSEKTKTEKPKSEPIVVNESAFDSLTIDGMDDMPF